MSSATLSDVVPALISNGFFGDAAADLRRTLAQAPDNAAAWHGLVRVCRAKGDLAAARAACEACRRLQPGDAQVGYLLAVLEGRALPAEPPPGERYVCPFVRVDAFLTDAEHSALLEFIARQHTSAIASKVRADEYEPDTRRSKLVPHGETRAVKRWFAPKIRRLLPEILPRLSSDHMDACRIELQMTVHNDGDRYNLHSDDHEADDDPRRLSYVYYFHEQPKRFTGGDLLLYDSDLVHRQCRSGFTRLEPLDNSIVFFPSAYFHQVTPIQCATRDDRHGRFTVNGWIHGSR